MQIGPEGGGDTVEIGAPRIVCVSVCVCVCVCGVNKSSKVKVAKDLPPMQSLWLGAR